MNPNAPNEITEMRTNMTAAKIELHMLLDAVPCADVAIEAAIREGRVDGRYYRLHPPLSAGCCIYGQATGTGCDQDRVIALATGAVLALRASYGWDHDWSPLERMVVEVRPGEGIATSVPLNQIAHWIWEWREYRPARAELWDLLEASPQHAGALLDTIERGWIDGSHFGDLRPDDPQCAVCIYGTIGRMRGGSGFDLARDVRQKLFGNPENEVTPLEALADRVDVGDTPALCPEAALMARWIREWMVSK